VLIDFDIFKVVNEVLDDNNMGKFGSVDDSDVDYDFMQLVTPGTQLEAVKVGMNKT
jgi:hypothetical protein